MNYLAPILKDHCCPCVITYIYTHTLIISLNYNGKKMEGTLLKIIFYLIFFMILLIYCSLQNHALIMYVLWCSIQKLINNMYSEDFYILLQVMLVLDSFLFLLILGGLHILKSRNPNFLFFCKGSILFLPPQQQPIQKSSKKQKRQEPQIKILQVNYNHVQQYPMRQQYQRVIFLISGLIIYLPLKFLVNQFCVWYAGEEMLANSAVSSFYYIICLMLMIYVIKVGLSIFWISSYNIKYSVLIAIGINFIFYILLWSLQNTSAVDHQLQKILIDYRKQLQIVFGKKLSETFFNNNFIILSLLFFNSVLCLICIPAVIKFGNWYTKTLKEVYYEDEEQISPDPQIRKQKQQRQKILKNKSLKTIRTLNAYLVVSLVFLFMSHRYIHQFLLPWIVDVLRIFLMAVMVFINVQTLKDAIEFNSSFAYKCVIEYVNERSEANRIKLRQKIVSYIYLIWYHKFQFMFRVIVPVLIFLMILDWKYVTHPPNNIQKLPPIISETHCGVYTNQLQILQNLYKCQLVNPQLQPNSSIVLPFSKAIHDISTPFMGGIILSKNMIDSLEKTQQRISKYGIMNTLFVIETLEILLWYFGIMLYGMTILYILFLRKTYYDI